MATIFKRGPSWYINWQDENGRHQQSLGKITETAAQASLAALQRRLTGAPPAAAGPPFADWAVKYASWHSREYPDSYFRIEQILRSHLLPAFGDLALMDITRKLAETYKHNRLAAGAAPGTVIKELRTLKACLNHAVAWDIIPRNPIQHVKPPKDLASKPPQWYSAEELAKIYAVELEIRKSTDPKKAPLHRQYRWSWQLMANTGLRRTEALHLGWRDVGKEELRVLSSEDARTKSGKWRSIPISAGAGESLQELKGAGRWILPRVRPESLSRAFDRTAKRANIGGSIHCLRHTYCSHLVMAGVPLRTVQILAGHAKIETTERYAHLAPGHLQDAVKGLRI